jgi:hypothetical protein
MDKSINSKTGAAPIKKVGHTFSGHFGSDPNAKVRGRGTEPSEQTFK